MNELIEFKTNIDKIKTNISTAYEVVSNSKNERWLLNQGYYRVMYEVITDFSNVTDWLDKKISNEQEKAGSDNKLVDSWIQIAKLVIDILKKTSSVSTTFEDSFGMGNGDSGFSNIALNLEDLNYDERPYFQDSLLRAAEILIDNGEFDLASRYALMSAIETIWSGGRYDHEDVTIALDVIPDYLWRKKECVKYIEFMTIIFEWLYAFYDEWGEQYYSSLYLHYFWLEILNNYNDLDEVAKNSIIDYVKKSVKNIVKFDRGSLLFEDYFMSYLIDEISKDNKFDDAFQIIKIRIDTLILNSTILVGTEQDDLDKYLKSLSNLIQIGFELKDKNSTNIKTLLEKMKSDVLESRLSSLAINLGYVGAEDKEWYYKNEIILEFIKDKNTKTVEIDVNQSKIEHQKGKERKVLFFSECKYKTKSATIRDVEFFYHKAIDFLEQQKDHARQYPKRLLPRYDELWFVSIKGFTDDTRLLTHKIGRCKIKLVDGDELNKHLKNNNIRKIEIF